VSDEVLSSSWCTNWGAFNTPRLWAMVSDEDDPDAWRQVAAWGEVAGAVQEHRARLVQARDALTAAWPPEQNGAARAFVTELNTLIARMDTAQTDADTTATGLANILEALRTAKTEIQPLYEQYKDKNSDWVPGWWDHAEDDIDKKALDQMIKAEQTVEQHVAQLKVPDPYTMDPKGGRIMTDPPSKGADSTGTGSSSAAQGTGSSSTRAVPVPHDPVPPMPGQDPIAPDGSGADGSPGSGDHGSGSTNPGSTVGGPGLAGVITPPGTTPPTGTPPGTGVLPSTGGAPGSVSPVIGGNPIPGVYPGPGSGGALPAEGGTLGNVKAGGLRGVTAASEVPPGLGGGYARGGRPMSTRGALPSGAVIGESVGGGARGAGRAGGASERGPAGRSGAGKGGTRGASKPTPPSWLPEEEGGAARGGRAGAAGMPGRGHRRGEGTSDHQPFDPDNPWEVAEGVDPVIIPPDDNDRHDPGPNVIGWRG
jgi:hypothetical protein